MEFFSLYANPAENAILWGAPAFFGAFLLFVLAAKLASGENCAARLYRIHFLFFIPYLVASLVFAASSGQLRLALLPAFATGCFIYFSLHYIYLMAFVGLAKKSVSVNILADIRELGADGRAAVAMTALLEHEKRKIAYVKLSRLNQLTALGMAERSQAGYFLTPRGRFLNRLGNTILKLWNLRRL